MKGERPWRQWRRIFGPHPDQEVDEELKFHLEQRTREYIAQGMSPESARRAAAEKFGDVTRVRETCTSMLAADRSAEARRTFVSISWLDVKLGLRMFAKYPALSIIAVLGMSLAIAIGAGYFGFIGAMLDSTLPIDEGDRVVMIQSRFVAGPDTGDTNRASEHDFVQWRSTLKSVEDLAAFRDESYNLIPLNPDHAPPRPVRVAAMTASAFRLTRVPPVIGRTLLDEDERPGAPPVLVIGYDDWQHHFNGDPGVLGTSVRLDETVYSIVGVMPDGYAFPRSHGYWVPLRLTAAAMDPAGEPAINVFGRIAHGFSAKQVQSELTTVGDRMAAAFPQTHRDIRPLALTYTHAFVGVEGPEVELAMRSLQVGVGLLLLIVAVNVAIVVYARTATRMGEIAVRTALGASRARIIMQLFVEALVLSVTAAVIGLTIVERRACPGSRTSSTNRTTRARSSVLDPLRRHAGVDRVRRGARRPRRGDRRRASCVEGDGKARARRATALRLARRLDAAWTDVDRPGRAAGGDHRGGAAGRDATTRARAVRIGMRAAAPAARDLVRGTLALTRDDATGDGGSAARARIGDPRFTDRMTTLLQRLEAEPEVSGVTYAQHVPRGRVGLRRRTGRRRVPAGADSHPHQRRRAESV